MNKEKKLLGIWKLMEYKLIYNDEKIIYPFGENPIGNIIYTLCGHMCVQIMRAQRLKCSTEYYFNITHEEKIEIADNFLCYMGKYKIINDNVVHYPEISSFTNYINIPQKREYKFEGNNLVLSCFFLIKGSNDRCHSYLTWRKLDV